MNATATILLAALALGTVACNDDAGFIGSAADARRPALLADQEFEAGRLGSDAVRFRVPFGLVEQRVTMQEKAPVVASFRQAERPEAAETFTQGNDGEPGEREFGVASLAQLDLLIVIDDSGSMGDEQDELKGKLKELTSSLKKIDWRIAVVTTSASRTFTCKVIDSKDADRQKAFETAIDAGINGDDAERGITQALRALQDAPALCKRGDQRWWRDGSELAVFFISDEEDHSNEGGYNDTPLKLYDRLTTLRDKTQLRAYALTWNNNLADGGSNKCRLSPPYNAEMRGLRYEQLVTSATVGVGGLVESICDPAKYAEVLTRISQDVSRIVKREFELPNPPEPGTLAMVMTDEDGAETPFTDYEIVGKKIKLKSVGDKDMKVKVKYRYNAKPKFARVQLANPAAAGTLAVEVDDQPLAPGGFAFDEMTGEVSFTDEPANNAVVKVKFRRDIPGLLRTDFELGALPIDGQNIEVAVDSKPAPGAAYDPASKILSLPEAPTDGAEVRVTYRVPGWRITRYGASVDDATDVRNGVTARDTATDEVLPLLVTGGELIFAEADIAGGREVVVTYDYGNPDDVLSHQLPREPIDGSVTVTDDGQTGCITGIAVDGRVVSFQCAADELGQIEITYSYVAEIQSSFEVALPADAALDELHWQVWVDGLVVPFTRAGNVVMPDPAALQPGSKVRVLASRM